MQFSRAEESRSHIRRVPCCHPALLVPSPGPVRSRRVTARPSRSVALLPYSAWSGEESGVGPGSSWQERAGTL